jgi:hypothetical protein
VHGLEGLDIVPSTVCPFGLAIIIRMIKIPPGSLVVRQGFPLCGGIEEVDTYDD